MNASEREISALSARVQANAQRLCGRLPGPVPRVRVRLLVPLGVLLALAAWLALSRVPRNRAVLGLGLRMAAAGLHLLAYREEAGRAAGQDTPRKA